MAREARETERRRVDEQVPMSEIEGERRLKRGLRAKEEAFILTLI